MENLRYLSNRRLNMPYIFIETFFILQKVGFDLPEESGLSHKVRTCVSVFRASCIEILRSLNKSTGSSNTHFVRCIRADLCNKGGFQTELIKQQLRALSVLDTAKAKQLGYSYRVPFNDFLRRYKFLAFEFDEDVQITKDNCRLLLIRLKLEGWVLGRSKVFLKYYNEEYLAR